jgi:hypothetical protein
MGLTEVGMLVPPLMFLLDKDKIVAALNFTSAEQLKTCNTTKPLVYSSIYRSRYIRKTRRQ